MRRKRIERHAPVGNVRMQIQKGQRSGNRVAKIEKISFSYDDRTLVRDFSTTIMRGDKIGILGPNGAGKTTLVRLLLGELEPASGNVLLGTNLAVAYFDQLRGQLDENKSVEENVGEGYDSITIDGRPRHVLGYLQDFLFSPERARMQIRLLSGGERNRVLLAKLFKRPANVIVLDEPTNDLDTETLELLEDWLVKFEGTVLVVSHDREFLNNVVTSTIVFEDRGVHEYVGGYDDWLAQRPDSAGAGGKSQDKTGHKATIKSARASTEFGSPAKPRLTYAEQIELKTLPDKIEQLESEIASLHDAMAQPMYYEKARDEISRNQSRLKEVESELAVVFSRWEDLEGRSDS
jgi:ATP-binding cassette subfamily F protein uup